MMIKRSSSMPVKNKIVSFLSQILKYFVFGINIFFLILLLASYSIWDISPVKNMYLAYLGLGFVFILLAIIGFLIAWIFVRNWIFASVNIVVLLICYIPITTYFPFHLTNKEVPANSIKILSYNVRGFNWELDKGWESNPIYTYLKDSDSDIICIQEYLALNNSRSDTESLRRLLGYRYVSVISLRSTKDYVYGLACFSKYPIVSVEQIPIKTTDNGSVMYKLEINGKIITLINNHLESNRLTSKDKALYASFFKDPKKESLGEVKSNIDDKLGKAFRNRAPQAELVAKYIDDHSKISNGVIVCGDFNDTPISYTYNQISNNMVDSYSKAGFGPGITYHENHFWFRIDYILHTPNIQSSNFVIDKVKYSDHYPISTYLTL